MQDARNQLHQDVGIVGHPSSETILSSPQDPLSYSLPADLSSHSPTDDSLAAFKVTSSSNTIVVVVIMLNPRENYPSFAVWQ